MKNDVVVYWSNKNKRKLSSFIGTGFYPSTTCLFQRVRRRAEHCLHIYIPFRVAGQNGISLFIRFWVLFYYQNFFLMLVVYLSFFLCVCVCVFVGYPRDRDEEYRCATTIRSITHNAAPLQLRLNPHDQIPHHSFFDFEQPSKKSSSPPPHTNSSNSNENNIDNNSSWRLISQ